MIDENYFLRLVAIKKIKKVFLFPSKHAEENPLACEGYESFDHTAYFRNDKTVKLLYSKTWEEVFGGP